MSEKFKLGLTRNRLFEFDNCVCFLGKTTEKFDVVKCQSAFKTLLLKEPILSCGIELCENGDAFLVTGAKEPCLEFYQGDEKSFVDKMKADGLDFREKLFSFVIINDSTLGVFAHTVVADVRALMYLADEFVNIYKTDAVSVVPSEMIVLSEVSQLPSNVLSVVIDKLSSELDVGWQKKTKVFNYSDYENARKKYISAKKEQNSIAFEIDKKTLCYLKSFAHKENADVSSLVAFAFYESLVKYVGGKRKYRKLNVQANERIFFPDGYKMQMGAYNGVITVGKTKNKKTPATIENKAKAFHGEIYKRVTSAFTTFYNEFLFMRLPASFTDSQYMYCAGDFHHKYSKKLAEVYGCANEVAGEFCSYNLNQKIWNNLTFFDTVVLSEPLKMRSTTMITFVEKEDSATVCFEYKKDRVSDETAQNIVKNAVDLLKIFN